MSKKILITGATDGIGLETAKLLVADGHQLLIHGRNTAKLDDVKAQLLALAADADVQSYVADFADLKAVDALADEVLKQHDSLDVLINNAGVLKTGSPVTSSGHDVRFVVNTLAPYRLTERLLPALGDTGRVVNLSSAAQAPVNLDALHGKVQLEDMGAYAQSKLALTMWSQELASRAGAPVSIAVNPGSLLASKMVKEGFGIPGSDLSKGALILRAAALDDAFAKASGQYFDNDSGQFAPPHQEKHLRNLGNTMDTRCSAAIITTFTTDKLL